MVTCNITSEIQPMAKRGVILKKSAGCFLEGLLSDFNEIWAGENFFIDPLMLEPISEPSFLPSS